MVTVAAASLVRLQGKWKSFFQHQLLARGLSSEEGRQTNLIRDLKVLHVMSKDFITLDSSVGLAEVKNTLGENPNADIIVTNQRRKFLGMIKFLEVKDILFNRDLYSLVNAGDIYTEDLISVHSAAEMGLAINIMHDNGLDRLPVIERNNPFYAFQ